MLEKKLWEPEFFDKGKRIEVCSNMPRAPTFCRFGGVLESKLGVGEACLLMLEAFGSPKAPLARHYEATMEPLWGPRWGKWCATMGDTMSATMRPLWSHYGSTMRLLWGHYEATMMPLCCHYGATMCAMATMGPLWSHYGATMEVSTKTSELPNVVFLFRALIVESYSGPP